MDENVWLSLDQASQFYSIPKTTFRGWIFRRRLNETNGLHKIGALNRINRREFESLFIEIAETAVSGLGSSFRDSRS